MAWHLFRLGRWSVRHRKTVVGLWLALLVLGGTGAMTLSGKTSDGFSLSGVESTQALELIEERVPDAESDAASARIVFEAGPGETVTTPEAKAAIAAAIETATTSSVDSVSDPFEDGAVSADGTVAYADISYTKPAADLSDADRSALERATETAEDAGLNAAVAGEVLDEGGPPPLGEIAGVVIAFLVLVVTLGSMLAAGMPMATALIGVAIGVLGITTLTGFMELGSTTPMLGIMLGLAVGIDYALFIMSRYRHEISIGREPEEAAGVAVGTAGSAVIFAGLTVAIALAGLAVCGIGFLTELGLAGAAMIALAVLIALTLLPAMLGFVGTRGLHSRIRFLRTHEHDPEDDTEDNTGRTLGQRWARSVIRHRVPALVVGVAVACLLSIPVLSMQLALPDDGTATAGSDRRVAYDLITDNFGAGANGPLVLVVDTADAADPIRAVDATVAKLEGISSGIAEIKPPDTASPDAAAALQSQLDSIGFTTITVVPDSGPSEAATKDLVDAIRAAVQDLPEQTGARALVTGQTAVDVDLAQALSDAFPRYLLVVVGLAILVLLLVFRSIIVPIKAALGFLLSLGISLGSTVAVFQWGWLNELLGLDRTSPVLFILPLLLTGILFGLAMDYEVFLVTRMREAHVRGASARDAIVAGFRHGARVVTAAALIMAGVFGGFAFGGDAIIKTIGFALTVGVLADAFLVRMTIVPAVMALIGDRIWWLPSWLDRILPKLDIEGEALLARVPAPQLHAADPKGTPTSALARGSDPR